MQISFDENTRSFHLTNGLISYIMQLKADNYLAHLYFGQAVERFNLKYALYVTEREGCPQPDGMEEARVFSLETLPQEYPAQGCGDFRIPALRAVLDNGTSALDLRYVSHEILSGKPALQGLPSSYVKNEDDAQTLEITLREVSGKLRVVLSYTIFRNLPILARHARISNNGCNALTLTQAASMSLDFNAAYEYDRVSMYGAHANERNIERRQLGHGIEHTSSVRGVTSHQHQNFIALCEHQADEHHGKVYGNTLVWSGNFDAATEVSCYGQTRLTLGINSEDFRWNLQAGETFTTPEAILCFSHQGFNGMSQAFHRFVREHIIRGPWQYRERPIVANSWEAAYFNFTEESIVRFAKDCVKLGAELIVLDDGWFGKRDKDNCSLGDWLITDTKKLPNGIKGLADKIHALGAKFGLWVEPEMISPNSELFRAHPDWALGVPDHKRSQQREQYVLDLSRQDVRDYIVDAICTVLRSAPIDYIKWDMNRNLSEVGSAQFPAAQQGEIATRFVLGVYDIMDRITSAFPEILFESCAGGGKRFDLGILCYMPQTWTSDNTDAICRQKIQYGTSYVFPPLTMGSHVSAVPNHQVGRFTPLLTRFICAMSGNFGYEMDLGKLSAQEQEEVKAQTALYKELRPLIQFGTFTRLMSPFAGTCNETAWSFMAEDGSKVALMYFKNLAEPSTKLRRLCLSDLDPQACYQVRHHLIPKALSVNPYAQDFNLEGEVFGGRELMEYGLTMDRVDADFAAYLIVLEKI